MNSDNSNIKVPPFELPVSDFLGEETRRALKEYQIDLSALTTETARYCPPLETVNRNKIPANRHRQAEIFYRSTIYSKLTHRYKVSIEPKVMAGVQTDVFTPAERVQQDKQDHVLINFHGGSFTAGSRTASHQESIPISASGKYKVISVDYRMAPEHRFPAASDDAFAVYKEVLGAYRPENIGIYGCSSGAVLCSQLIARLLKENQPLPAAVAMSCWGAHGITGDSNHTVMAQMGMPPFTVSDMAYFRGVDLTNPLAIPGTSSEILAQFPPSLLMTSTRDFMMSSVVYTHSELARLGMNTELHVWEGLEHAFLLNSELTESRQAYDTMIRFFDRRFGNQQ